MMRAVFALVLTAAPAFAQDSTIETTILQDAIEDAVVEAITPAGPKAATGAAGELRVLDKITGQVTDLTLTSGQATTVGPLGVQLGECRYPVDNPSGDAYAEMRLTYEGQELPLFEGWMIASSPALSALDHPRYDVWVLRCITS